MENDLNVKMYGSQSLTCDGVCDGCGECIEACRKSNLAHEKQAAIQLVAMSKRHAPVFCRNCHDAPCVTACMPGCRHKDETSGRIVTDYERCVGCWMCIMVCPLGAIQRVPAHPGQHHGKALKCDGCIGHAEAPCVSACQRNVLREVQPGGLSIERRFKAALNIGNLTLSDVKTQPDQKRSERG